MQLLPRLFTEDQTLSLIQSKWTGILNPLLQNPLNNCLLLTGISLINGTNVINHTLGRTMQGWFVTDLNGSATIYRTQPFNDTTLTLSCNALVTVSLGVF